MLDSQRERAKIYMFRVYVILKEELKQLQRSLIDIHRD